MRKRLITSLIITGLLSSLILPGQAAPARKYDIIETTAPSMDLLNFDAFDENGLACVKGQLTEFVYRDYGLFEHNFINKYGQIAIPISDEYYYYYPDINGTCVILDRNIKASDGSITYSSEDKHGLVDPQGKVLLPPIYDDIGWFSEGLAVIKKDGKAGFINSKGEVVLPMVYEDAGAFSEGLAAAKRDNKWGYIDMSGKWIIEPQFYAVDRFYEGRAVVLNDSRSTKYGFIDRSGKPAFSKTFDYAADFKRGLAVVEVDHKWGAVDSTGKVVVPFIYFQLFDYGHEFLYAKVQTDGAFMEGLVDRKGNVRIPVEYDAVYMNDEAGLITVEKDGKWGVVDKDNKTVIPIEYDERISYYDGYAAARKDKKYGYFDTAGRLVIPFMYEAGLNFFDGVTSVKKNGVWMLIDGGNNDLHVTTLQDAHYDLFWDFSYGLAQTKKDGKWGVIQLISYPDAWAQPEVKIAISNGFIPESMQYYYSDDITRKEFCDLIIAMITAKSGMPIDDYLALKGTVRDFTAFDDIRINDVILRRQDMNILAAQALGIVSGKGDHEFDPSGKITRQEAATMLFGTGQLLGVVQQSGTSNYNDSGSFASWSASAIRYVSSVTDKTNGKTVMGGIGNNTFAPNSYFTHEQAIISILRLYNAA